MSSSLPFFFGIYGRRDTHLSILISTRSILAASKHAWTNVSPNPSQVSEDAPSPPRPPLSRLQPHPSLHRHENARTQYLIVQPARLRTSPSQLRRRSGGAYQAVWHLHVWFTSRRGFERFAYHQRGACGVICGSGRRVDQFDGFCGEFDVYPYSKPNRRMVEFIRNTLPTGAGISGRMSGCSSTMIWGIWRLC